MDAVAAMGAMAMDAMAGGGLNSALHDGRALVGAARNFLEITPCLEITAESNSLHGRYGRDGPPRIAIASLPAARLPLRRSRSQAPSRPASSQADRKQSLSGKTKSYTS